MIDSTLARKHPTQNRAMDKATARTELHRRINAIDSAQLAVKNHAICEHLGGTKEFARAQVIMMFLSLNCEVDTSEAITCAFEQGKTIVVPRVIWQARRLVPIILTSLACPMKIDRYGLREPIGAEPMSVARIDLVVTPGVGFDRQGHRLGRGGGFYDRFLRDSGVTAVSCGLAFEEQIMPSVPVQPHDIAIDMLITDTGLSRFDTGSDSNRPAQHES